MPTIHHYTDSEIIYIVVSSEKNGSEEKSSDENEEGVRERISIDRLIKNCSPFLLQYIQSGDKTSIIRKFKKIRQSEGRVVAGLVDNLYND